MNGAVHDATEPEQVDLGRVLVTGVAGFIGSHLLEALLRSGVEVTGVDSFVTSDGSNLDEVRRRVGERWSGFRLVEGDLRDASVCERAVEGAAAVVHLAALNSVPRSVDDPVQVGEVNVMSMLNLLHAASRAAVGRFVYASSSSVYGDVSTVVRTEGVTGVPLSPYAASKSACEAFAGAFERVTGMPVVGLRYFNVYGPRQNPDGPYSAVIPRWIGLLLRGEPPVVNGTGTQCRDFTNVADVVRANVSALVRPLPDVAGPRVYNVGTGRPTRLTDLLATLRVQVARARGMDSVVAHVAGPERPGDVHSALADVARVRSDLGFEARVSLADGLQEMVDWYVRDDHRSLSARP